MTLAVALAAPGGAVALNLEDDTDRINYSLGYQIGGDFKRQGVEMIPEAVVRGMRDALEGAKPQMTQAERRAALTALQREVTADTASQGRSRAEAKLERDLAFLEKNALEEGITTLDSGLQYEIVKPGTGDSPGPADTVTVHYRASMLGSSEFYDSRRGDSEPLRFSVEKAFPALREALPRMKEGGRWRLFVPPELGYRGSGPAAGRVLVVDVELLEVGAQGAGSPGGEVPSQAGD
jgi:FKBP-type peptidyl-prolyl cis-trans isomerase FklB